jgi:hypothetical protein
MVVAAAIHAQAEHIVTRNKKDFQGAPVEALSPEELLNRLDPTSGAPPGR